MASVGGISVYSIRGRVDGAQERVEVIGNENVDGLAALKTGVRGEPFELRSMVFTNSTALIGTIENSYRAIVGSVVSVVDDHGVTWTNLLVLRVKAAGEQVYAVAQPSSSSVRVDAIWTLQSVATVAGA